MIVKEGSDPGFIYMHQVQLPVIGSNLVAFRHEK